MEVAFDRFTKGRGAVWIPAERVQTVDHRFVFDRPANGGWRIDIGISLVSNRFRHGTNPGIGGLCGPFHGSVEEAFEVRRESGREPAVGVGSVFRGDM